MSKFPTAKFSGWRNLILLMLVLMATMGFGFLTLSLYVPVFITDLNASLSTITGMFSVLSIVAMCASMSSGPVSRRIGIHRMIMLGVGMMLAAYAVLYFSNSIATLYIAAGLIGGGLSWSGFIALGRVVSAWFVHRRGLALGIASSASGIGALIAAPLVSNLILGIGWRNAVAITFGIIVVLAVPAVIALRPDPTQIGQRPLLVPGSSHEDYKPADFDAPKVKFRISLPFILMVVVVLSGAYSIAGFSSQVANALVVKGFDLAFAGIILAIVAVFNIIGAVLLGLLADRMGTTAALIGVGACGFVGFLLLPFAGSIPVAVAFGVFYGLVQAGSITMFTLLTARVFGMKQFPLMLGIVDGLIGILSVGTPLVISFLFEATGSYTAPALLGAGIFIAYVACGIGAIRLGDRARAREVKEDLAFADA